jgi:hypothetical protein
MKRHSFPNGVCFAAVLALLASIATTVFTPILSAVVLYKLLVPALSLAYIVYFLARCPEKVGRVTALALWTAVAAGASIMEPSLTLYIALHVGAVWLIRSIYTYSSIVSALMDLGLNVTAVSSMYWAAMHSGSIFLAIWCFFLVQALFVAIPPAVTRQPGRKTAPDPDIEQFERARRRADAALRQLFTQ